MTIARLRSLHTLANGAAALIVTVMLHGCDGAGAGAAAARKRPGRPRLAAGGRQEGRTRLRGAGQRRRADGRCAERHADRLDPHSDYMDQDQYQQMNAVTRGQFGGIGIELTLEGRVPEVIAPIEGTPAANAGIEPGDRIVKIDGQATTGMDVETIVKRLRGTAGAGDPDHRAQRPAAIRHRPHPRRDPRRLGQMGARTRPDRLRPDHDVFRRNPVRAGARHRQAEGPGAWPLERPGSRIAQQSRRSPRRRRRRDRRIDRWRHRRHDPRPQPRGRPRL